MLVVDLPCKFISKPQAAIKEKKPGTCVPGFPLHVSDQIRRLPCYGVTAMFFVARSAVPLKNLMLVL